MNPLLYEMYAKERHEDFLREARRMRLIALSRKDHQTILAKFRITLGNFFIRLGHNLKKQSFQREEIEHRLCRE
jgi:hypothetical protein